MHHTRFDLRYWQDVFADDDFRDGCWPVLGLVGPHDVCRLERLRERLHAAFDLGTPVPTDIFVFALGEAPDLSVTKFGGIPYRPADLPWPRKDLQTGTTLVASTEELMGIARKRDKDLPATPLELQEYISEEFPPLRFLAQFNFVDSLDLVGPLPGDVLLLFGDYDWPFIHMRPISCKPNPIFPADCYACSTACLRSPTGSGLG